MAKFFVIPEIYVIINRQLREIIFMKNENIYKQGNTNEYLLDAWWGLVMTVIALLGFTTSGIMAWALD